MTFDEVSIAITRAYAKSLYNRIVQLNKTKEEIPVELQSEYDRVSKRCLKLSGELFQL